jgi:hypothetical protein
MQQVLKLAGLDPERFVGEAPPTMFSESAPAHVVDRFVASMSGFHPPGLRAMRAQNPPSGGSRPALRRARIAA